MKVSEKLKIKVGSNENGADIHEYLKGELELGFPNDSPAKRERHVRQVLKVLRQRADRM